MGHAATKSDKVNIWY